MFIFSLYFLFVRNKLNLDKINNKLSEKLYATDEIYEFFYPDILLQCSDISKFPDKFD